MKLTAVSSSPGDFATYLIDYHGFSVMGKTARELMDEPDFIDADAPVGDVEKEFQGSENTLIVRRDGEVIGEIHENSLLKLLIPEERLDEERVIGILGFAFDSSYVAEKAEDLMNRHEVTVSPDEDIDEIAFLMDREDVRAVPVEDGGDIVGVVHENRMMEEI
ncbi:MAG: HPP family protein [Candidatus Nanohaloarchaea archaeon]